MTIDKAYMPSCLLEVNDDSQAWCVKCGFHRWYGGLIVVI